MAAEIILIGSAVMFFTVTGISEWSKSRCSSKEVWFHDWKRDESCAETTHRYQSGSRQYTSHWGMYECTCCHERRDMCVGNDEPEYEID